MNFTKHLCLYTLILLTISSCATDLDDNPVTTTNINDFIYKGLKTYYLYNNLVPDLIEDKTLNTNYNTYLNASSPKLFFENLIYDRQNTDRFSWITNDYLALEQQFQGTSIQNGMVFGLNRITPGSNNLYGYVKYVLPNTVAETEGVSRGQLFTKVNNELLTISNYRSLLNQTSYSIQLANYNIVSESFEENGTTINLIKQIYTENPVFKAKVLTVNNQKIGYLMYNRFTREFDRQLNSTFGDFAANNINELVVDLRYNPGGSVNTATLLASLITGQFNNLVFSTLQYNENLSSENQNFNFNNTLNNQSVNSLNLTQVYILTTDNTASASEMIINSLKPYIKVIQIGTTTVGKSQASITLYDSANYTRNNVNPLHLYAMQPLVAKTVNKNNVGVPNSGLVPNTVIAENALNLSKLGEITEPLLAEALAQMTSKNKIIQPQTEKKITKSIHSSSFSKFNDEMYLNQLPNN